MPSMTTSLQFWMSGVNNAPSINNLDRMEPKILKFYNIHWIRGLHARKSTIMNEWCLQWPEVTSLNKWSQQWNQYQHSWQSGVTNILKSIILTELEDYRHEYLRLWMRDAFNDYKFTFWMSGVNNAPNINNLHRMEPEKIKFYIIDWVRRLQARIFTIINECCLQWQEVYKFE